MSKNGNILVLNAGSSSLRFAVFDELPARVLSGKFDRIGLPKSVFMTQTERGEDLPAILNWKWSGDGVAARSSTEGDNA